MSLERRSCIKRFLSVRFHATRDNVSKKYYLQFLDNGSRVVGDEQFFYMIYNNLIHSVRPVCGTHGLGELLAGVYITKDRFF